MALNAVTTSDFVKKLCELLVHGAMPMKSIMNTVLNLVGWMCLSVKAMMLSACKYILSGNNSAISLSVSVKHITNVHIAA